MFPEIYWIYISVMFRLIISTIFKVNIKHTSDAR
jgi:hypothetical protein